MPVPTRKRKVPHVLRETLAANVGAMMEIVYRDAGSKTRALAHDTTVSHSTVQRILSCASGATIDNIAAFAEALGVLPWQLLATPFDPERLPLLAMGDQARAEAEAFNEVRQAIQIVKNRYTTPPITPLPVAEPAPTPKASPSEDAKKKGGAHEGPQGGTATQRSRRRRPR